MRALVIDSDPARRSRLTALLEVPGICISTASQALSAIHEVIDARPDVVFLGVDSADSWVLHALAAVSPKIPIIAYAERYDSGFERTAAMAGASEVVSLRAGRSVLLDAILQATRRR